MAHDVRELAVTRLLLDEANARLGEEQPSQQATLIALATKMNDQIFALGEDILENGTDPTNLPAVVKHGGRQYRVLEGNRRVLTLKCLETPSLLDAVLTAPKRKRWGRMAQEYAANRIEKVSCAIFESEEDARHWIELRHTGANAGAGLVEWDSNEQDRYQARHGGSRKRLPAGQIIDFVNRIDPPTDEASNRYITTLQRFINTPEVRIKLGIEVIDGDVHSWFPGAQVAVGLLKVVNDLRYGTKDVTDLYYKPGRLTYVNSLSDEELPLGSTRLDALVKLADLNINVGHNPEPTPSSEPADGSDEPDDANLVRFDDSGGLIKPGTNPQPDISDGEDQPDGSNTPVRPRPIPPASQRQRSSVIPRSCTFRINSGRLNNIYHELRKLDVNEFTNAAAVTLRVFVELSADNYIDRRGFMNEAEHKGASLAKKLKESADDLRKRGMLTVQQERTVERIANGVGPLAASTMNMHQFVHNEHVYPRPSELLTAWDELETFMRAVWSDV